MIAISEDTELRYDGVKCKERKMYSSCPEAAVGRPWKDAISDVSEKAGYNIRLFRSQQRICLLLNSPL